MQVIFLCAIVSKAYLNTSFNVVLYQIKNTQGGGVYVCVPTPPPQNKNHPKKNPYFLAIIILDKPPKICSNTETTEITH